MEFLLGLLCSKLIKYFVNVFLNNSPATQVGVIENIPIPNKINKKIEDLVKQIIKKQKQNPLYDYINNEQKEIDKLVYEMYGLDEDDIREVECWYARKWSKLERFCNCK